MPRPRKCRKVCAMPEIREFAPVGMEQYAEIVVLNVDEYEAIRLIDNEGLSQEQCSEHMHVARTTVQQIYASARRKLALSLVNGLPLRISGGDYRICDGRGNHCGCGGCKRHRHAMMNQNNEREDINENRSSNG